MAGVLVNFPQRAVPNVAPLWGELDCRHGLRPFRETRTVPHFAAMSTLRGPRAINREHTVSAGQRMTRCERGAVDQRAPALTTMVLRSR
jgi:hypothetical protein